MDETRIDAAPTPAHIFAYRAFRSVFVRSPDSSPIRPRETANTTYNRLDNDKENALKSPTRQSRFATSPVKSKRKDSEIDIMGNDIILTPKRQKTVPVSPSKSILKKANVPTPRRPELRDVTVTFKDVRKSISPEQAMARRPSPTRIHSQPELGRTAIRKLVEDVIPRPQNVITNTNMIKSGSELGIDLENYKTQTEKEMRRLMKYAHKWKEQARRSDEQVVNLETLLEEARKENERLQSKILQLQQAQQQKTVETKPVTNPVHQDAKRTQAKLALEIKAQEVYEISPEPKQRIYPRRTDQPPKPHEPQDPPVNRTETQPIQQPKTAPDFNISKRASESQTHRKERPSDINEHVSKTQQHKPEPKTNIPSVPASPSPSPNTKSDTGSRTLPVRSASSADGPVARRAAARQRVERRRMALRAASSQAALGGKKDGFEGDESQVDWLAMV